MQEIKRELYLSRLRPFYDSDLIKILVGIRRCGKSVLLEQAAAEIAAAGTPADHLIAVNFELTDYSHIRDAAALVAFVRPQMTDKNRYYLFFDEIQRVDGFADGLNTLRVSGNCSIFITGSNGKLLSAELNTGLTGRYVELRVQPFTYREVKQLYEANGRPLGEQTFYDYLTWGGMPQRFWFTGEREVRTYLSDLFDSIVMKDIVTRFKVKDPDLLARLTDYLLDNSARLFSANNIVKYLQKDGRKVSTSTVYNYLRYILSSLIVNNVVRYDTKGKRCLAGSGKYFCADTGLRQVRAPDAGTDAGVLLETVVFNELIARGYQVRIGKTSRAEVDFIATRDGKKIYLQVCYLMADRQTADREFAPLREVRDDYPKYVLSLDRIDLSRDGIQHLNVIDGFLLSDRF